MVEFLPFMFKVMSSIPDNTSKICSLITAGITTTKKKRQEWWEKEKIADQETKIKMCNAVSTVNVRAMKIMEKNSRALKNIWSHLIKITNV